MRRDRHAGRWSRRDQIRSQPCSSSRSLRKKEPGPARHQPNGLAQNNQGRSAMPNDLGRKCVRRRPTLPRSGPRSTIGAERLSFRVRDGTGRFPLAMVAETLWRYPVRTISSKLETGTVPREPHSGRVAFLWQILGLLVPVSSKHYCSSTSGLSTRWSSRGPYSIKDGSPHLETSFPLRCFQRLSLPNVANQQCPW